MAENRDRFEHRTTSSEAFAPQKTRGGGEAAFHLPIESAVTHTTPTLKPDREKIDRYDSTSNKFVPVSANRTVEAMVGNDIRKAWKEGKWLSVAGNSFFAFVVCPIINAVAGGVKAVWHFGEGLVTLKPVRMVKRIAKNIYQPIRSVENVIDGIRGNYAYRHD